MLKWVSRSSNLESEKTLQSCPESPSQFPSYADSPELFFSPRGDLSSESPARLAPVYQISSAALLDSGVGSISSKNSLPQLPESPVEPGDESDSLEFLSLPSLMVSLPCLLQVPVVTAQQGGLAFLLIYSLVLLLLVWPCLHLQAGLRSLLSSSKFFYYYFVVDGVEFVQEALVESVPSVWWGGLLPGAPLPPGLRPLQWRHRHRPALPPPVCQRPLPPAAAATQTSQSNLPYQSVSREKVLGEESKAGGASAQPPADGLHPGGLESPPPPHSPPP